MSLMSFTEVCTKENNEHVYTIEGVFLILVPMILFDQVSGIRYIDCMAILN